MQENLELGQHLRQGLRFRRNQQNDMAWDVFIHAKGLLEKEKNPSLEIRLNKALLESSLVRNKGDFKHAQNLLEEEIKHIPFEYLVRDYNYNLEKGLNYFTLADFENAIDCFGRAEKVAGNDEDKFIAKLNRFFAYSRIDLQTEKIEQELRILVAGGQEFGCKNALEQWKYCEAKKNLINGMPEIDLDLDRTSQLMFFNAYISELPFLNINSVYREKWAEFKDLYLGKFRFRTLTGSLHPDDFDLVSEYDVCDRIYLWFWRWIVQPESDYLERVFEFIDGLRKISFSQLATINRVRINNILLWINFLGDINTDSCCEVIHCKPDDYQQFPLYALEKEFVHYLSALKNKKKFHVDSIRENLQGSDIFNNNKNLFRSWIENNYFEKFFNLGPKNTSNKYLIRVDEISNTIILNGGKTIPSEQMCHVLNYLNGNSHMKCEDFAKEIYGLFEYDFFIHLPKIRALLSRLKKLTNGVFDYKIKDGIIHIQSSWDLFVFDTNSKFFYEVRRYSWKKAISRLKKITNLPSKRFSSNNQVRILPDISFSRTDLQQVLGISRSGAGRLLGKWIKSGMVQKTGLTKNVKYIIKQKYYSQIKSEYKI